MSVTNRKEKFLDSYFVRESSLRSRAPVRGQRLGYCASPPPRPHQIIGNPGLIDIRVAPYHLLRFPPPAIALQALFVSSSQSMPFPVFSIRLSSLKGPGVAREPPRCWRCSKEVGRRPASVPQPPASHSDRTRTCMAAHRTGALPLRQLCAPGLDVSSSARVLAAVGAGLSWPLSAACLGSAETTLRSHANPPVSLLGWRAVARALWVISVLPASAAVGGPVSAKRAPSRPQPGVLPRLARGAPLPVTRNPSCPADPGYPAADRAGQRFASCAGTAGGSRWRGETRARPGAGTSGSRVVRSGRTRAVSDKVP
jgi:hypothetical protein